MNRKKRNIRPYEEIAEEVLKSVNRYSQGLKLQIKTLASALMYLDMANSDIKVLDSTFITEETRTGKRLVPHPAFAVAKDSITMIIRQMSIIGLTAGDLSGDSEEDRLATLTEELIKVREKPVIIKPKKASSKKSAAGTSKKKE